MNKNTKKRLKRRKKNTCIEKTRIKDLIPWNLVAFVVVVFGTIIGYDYMSVRRNIDAKLNYVYMSMRGSEHVLICRYTEKSMSTYEIDCKNTLKYFPSTEVPKNFLSDRYLRTKYGIKYINRYKGFLGSTYLIGWFEYPNKEVQAEIRDIFLDSYDRFKTIERILNSVKN